MTIVSYTLFAVSGILFVAAVVVFFAMDITKCWRMVSGARCVHGKKQLKTDKKIVTNKTTTSTVLLDDGNLCKTEVIDI